MRKVTRFACAHENETLRRLQTKNALGVGHGILLEYVPGTALAYSCLPPRGPQTGADKQNLSRLEISDGSSKSWTGIDRQWSPIEPRRSVDRFQESG
jgi:hypothetical protein